MNASDSVFSDEGLEEPGSGFATITEYIERNAELMEKQAELMEKNAALIDEISSLRKENSKLVDLIERAGADEDETALSNCDRRVEHMQGIIDDLKEKLYACDSQGAFGRAYRDVGNYVESWYSGEAGVRRRRKIHKGPNGGRYYIKNGKKVYVKRSKRRATKKRHS
jgi:predicted RNase H-like nuclease (RuvC/YqgF family)